MQRGRLLEQQFSEGILFSEVFVTDCSSATGSEGQGVSWSDGSVLSVYYILLIPSQMKIKTLFVSFFGNEIQSRMNLCRASQEDLWFPYPYLKTAALVIAFLFVSVNKTWMV